MSNEQYLGDSVYASFDGYHVWLRTGDRNAQRIALDPYVFVALISYQRRVTMIVESTAEEGNS